MFKVDFRNTNAIEWSKNNGTLEKTVNKNYSPVIYIKTNKTSLVKTRGWIAQQNQVKYTEIVEKKTKLYKKPEKVLKIHLNNIKQVKNLVRKIRKNSKPGEYRFYNIDFSPQFRYCLENQEKPQTEKLEKTGLKLSRKQLSKKSIKQINKEKHRTEKEALINVKQKIRSEDPDIIVVNHADIIPLIHEKAEKHGIKLYLGREKGQEQLAKENQFQSFGKTKHSPSRYNIPGRIIINTSNSFLWNKTGLNGIKYLAKKSWKPLQELAWASIGNTLTAIQIKQAHKQNTVIPWKAWEPENFKTLDKIHQTDRGGFIFNPKTGIHEEIHELDFSSMYPRIMIEKNISPDTILCKCHKNNKTVPQINYNTCKKQGFLGKVLEPLVNDRQKIKEKLKEQEDKELQSHSDAIKWILVSCFGYQGFKNAKFGRIECHEAINAHARDIMMTAKQKFEESNYRIVHGIIDSLWVNNNGGKTEIKQLAEEITKETSIPLEYENKYKWIAFVPRKNSNLGSLNRYYGKTVDNNFVYKGIETRQQNTPIYIKESQKELIREYDRTRNPEKVLKLLKKQLQKIENQRISPENLFITQRTSKTPGQYKQHNNNWAALKRLQHKGVTVNPGEKITYLVVDNEKKNKEKVRLKFEDNKNYDEKFYKKKMLKAGCTVLRPLDFTEEQVKQKLKPFKKQTLQKYTK